MGRFVRATATCDGARLFAAVLLASLSLGLTACGGGDSGEEDAVVEALNTHFAALAEGDGETACDAATGSYQREMFSDNAGDLGDFGGLPSCAERVSGLYETLGADNFATLDDYKVENTEVDGDTARVTVTQDGVDTECFLEKQADGWKVSADCQDVGS